VIALRAVRRVLFLISLVAALVLVIVAPASAHTGFTPEEVGPGTVVDVTLNAADERDAAIITSVELFWPDGLTLTALAPPAGPGTFTATMTPTGILWQGGSAEGDQQFPITLGPLPAEPGRLQFKVLQTYDNGEVDRWIEDWPEGAPEPAMPGPVLVLVPGGPGRVPPTTSTGDTTAAPTLVAETTTIAAPLLIGGVIIVGLIAGGAFFFSRRRLASA
jgi:hypothetical protein